MTDRAARPILITGGAGFIGTNVAARYLGQGRPVIVFDNLSRPGVADNARWLRETYGSLVTVVEGDVRDAASLRPSARRASEVFHFAAQVAVTTSLVEPRHDFEVNVVGTINLLEELRRAGNPAPLVYTSTNKVYGGLSDIELTETASRYAPANATLAAHGVSEARHLDFHTPYGCSKGSAEQYVLDYARSFGQPATVFRMSCIYGPHQCGTEDQGWVAHFLLRALEGEPIVLYGDGKQVRDVLFVEDLVDAFQLAQRHMDSISGQAFNIGGGVPRTTSLLELLDLIAQLHRERPRTRFEPWRPGDQRYYISDISRFQQATGWMPRTVVRDGIARLYHWLSEHRVAAPELVTAGRGAR